MRIKTVRWVGTVFWMGITVALILPAGAQSLTDFEKRVHEFTLDNGLKFLVLERHDAPVVSFHTYADVGSVDEVKGITGMAHVFEHMAFKGSKTVGTLDYAGEVQVLERVDEAFLALKKERSQGNGKAVFRRLSAFKYDQSGHKLRTIKIARPISSIPFEF